MGINTAVKAESWSCQYKTGVTHNSKEKGFQNPGRHGRNETKDTKMWHMVIAALHQLAIPKRNESSWHRCTLQMQASSKIR